tara:strand:+ start:20 stop:1177 length:1158 start_codon:yes stop_codon:yes gene_type:complete
MVNFDQEYDAYIATEIGNYSVGGVSFWVDNWVRYVVPYLRVKPILIIEVAPTAGTIRYTKSFVLVLDRPGTEHKYEWKYPGLQLENYFSLPTTEYTDKIIKNARKVHLLSCPYSALYKKTAKEAIEKYGNIESVIAHSLERDCLGISKKYFHTRRKRELFDQKKQLDLHEGLNKIANETIWIGVDEQDEIGQHIPNFYKFKYNLKAVESNVVGYAARDEARKNFHYLQNLESIALTHEDSIEYWENLYKKKICFDDVRIEQYSRGQVDEFYKRKDWGIFHGAYTNEPFGYSIFQAVDCGKIPIIFEDWCEDMDYPFRADSVKEFEIQVAKIKQLSLKKRNSYLQQLRKYLSKFSSEIEWRDKLLGIYNKSDEGVWLPGDLQPSNS